MIYLTRSIRNPYTNEPYALEISDRTMTDFRMAEEQARQGKSVAFRNADQLIRCWEFTLFPAFGDVCQVWTDGYSKELMKRILTDFGVPHEFIEQLLADDEFVAKAKPWFNGITCDGERASRTLKIIYDELCSHFPQTPA